MVELADLITRQLPQGTVCIWTMKKTEHALTLNVFSGEAILKLPGGFHAEDINRLVDSDSVLDSLSTHIIKNKCDSFREVKDDQGNSLIFTWAL